MVLLMLVYLFIQPDPAVSKYRLELDKAYKSDAYAADLYEEMNQIKDLSAVDMAYLATLEMIMADNAMIPWAKLKHFNRGVELLDTAVASDDTNEEIRYLRFACQTKAPGFLDYTDHLEEDFELIKSNYSSLTDSDLKRRIQKIVKNSKHVTDQEKQLFL